MKLHSNMHETNKIRKHSAKSKLLYSTRFEDDLPPNMTTIKQYQLKYNYETMESFEDASLRNQITDLHDGALIEQSMIDHITSIDTPLLRSSENSEPLFSIDESETLQWYHSQKQDPREDRKRRYIEYFKRHYGSL
jgi:hypothetical protein